MIDDFTLKECQNNSEILNIKIKNLEYAISQLELLVIESNMDNRSLTFVRRKMADSIQDLETLYLLKKNKRLK